MTKTSHIHNAALGGTFDHFHVGHQHLISEASRQSCHLQIGVTADTFSRHTKIYPELIESYSIRKQAVVDFCQKEGIAATITQLNDGMGIAANSREIQALFYTSDVQIGAERINKYRNDHQLPELLLIEVSLLFTNESEKISSENIRSGKIDRYGRTLHTPLRMNQVLNDDQRTLLRKPLGDLVIDKPADTHNLRLLVGDSTLERFQSNHWPYDMAVIDGKKSREEYRPLAIEPSAIDLVLVNPASQITTMLSNGLQLALKHKFRHIFVDGEEDLAALVLILLSPLESEVYYGQPREGLIKWPANEASKSFVYSLLSSQQ